MGLGIMFKQVLLLTEERGKVGLFDISRVEGNENKEPKAIAAVIKSMLSKGYLKRDDEGGLKLYSLTEKGLKKVGQLKKLIQQSRRS